MYVTEITPLALLFVSLTSLYWGWRLNNVFFPVLAVVASVVGMIACHSAYIIDPSTGTQIALDMTEMAYFFYGTAIFGALSMFIIPFRQASNVPNI
jgi:hypothetical protein